MNVTPMRDRGKWCEEHQRRECTSKRKNGTPCHSHHLVTGQDKCRMHLGRKAEVARDEAKLEQEAARLLHKHDAAPVTNHLEALQRLAGRALALEEFFGEKANELKNLRYGTEGGGEQLRAEVAVLERAMDRCGRLLVDLARLNIEDRMAAVREKTARMLEQALDQALEASGASLDGKAKAREAFRRNLRIAA